ncbi:MAG: transcriptional repressor [Bacteroidales bacterium]|nr:transcriptional repressor [Bacteroidales bacterium]
MNANKYILKIKEAGLKVTPQRVAILKVLTELNNHPCAEEIAEVLKKDFPGLSLATIYNTLETLAQKQIITKVQSADGKLRFDARLDMHHHLHEMNTGKIEDYYDEDLNSILQEYFSNKSIPGFIVQDIKLQIKGEYINQKLK